MEGKAVDQQDTALGALSPQEAWDLCTRTREQLMESGLGLPERPSMEISRNGRGYRAVVTKWADSFWKGMGDASWEPETFRIYDELLQKDQVYLDIGAWIGPTVLYAVQGAKAAHAFEPDPAAFAELDANVTANRDAAWASRLKIHNKAVAATTGSVRFGNRYAAGDSVGSVLFAEGEGGFEVATIAFGELLEQEGLENERLFIKMDIEGGEYDLLPRIRPVLERLDVEVYLSLHPHFLDEQLRKECGGGLLGKLKRRLRFVQAQREIIEALPGNYRYYSSGRPFRVWRELVRAFRHCTFPHEIVVTNRPWPGRG